MSGCYEIQGIGIEDLAERFGTPMYLYDGDLLRKQFGELRERLHPAMEMFFSLKSNPNVSICALLHSLGARAEVSSMTELVTARRAGVEPENILFLGPGKSRDEITACVREGIAAIICESYGELALIDEVARAEGEVTSVVIRMNPAFSVKGSGLTMGGKPRQFGIDEAELFERGPAALRFPGIRVIGVQAYMGTRILKAETIAENTRRIFDLAERVSEHCEFPLELVDVGGGLGIPYFAGEADLDTEQLTDQVNKTIEEFTARHPETRLVMELGRYLTAPSGIYVVRVRYTKSSMGEAFAVCDGGTNHHMAAVGIGSFVKRNYPMVLLSRPDEPATEKWNVSGPLCTPNDVVGKAVQLPAVRPGDLVGVLRSGAYGPTASPVNFLSHGAPAEVLVDRGQALVIRERDTVADLLRAQRLVSFVENPATAAAIDPSEGVLLP